MRSNASKNGIRTIARETKWRELVQWFHFWWQSKMNDRWFVMRSKASKSWSSFQRNELKTQRCRKRCVLTKRSKRRSSTTIVGSIGAFCRAAHLFPVRERQRPEPSFMAAPTEAVAMPCTTKLCKIAVQGWRAPRAKQAKAKPNIIPCRLQYWTATLRCYAREAGESGGAKVSAQSKNAQPCKRHLWSLLSELAQGTNWLEHMSEGAKLCSSKLCFSERTSLLFIFSCNKKWDR